MHSLKFVRYILVLVMSVIFSPHLFAAAIIANPSCETESLSAKDLKNIFLGKKKSWPNGSKVTLAVLSKGDLHTEFTRKHVGRSASQFKSYWKKMIFTGKGAKPATFKDEQELIKFVAETEGAIGYISGESAEGVSIISIQ